MRETLTHQIARLEAQMDTLSQVTSEETECLNQQVIALRKRVVALEQQVSSLEQRDD